MKYDDKGCKWLRIRNWQKYEPDGKLRNKEVRLVWIRDYTEKLENYDYIRLSLFERAVFEGVCLIAPRLWAQHLQDSQNCAAQSLFATSNWIRYNGTRPLPVPTGRTPRSRGRLQPHRHSWFHSLT